MTRHKDKEKRLAITKWPAFARKGSSDPAVQKVNFHCDVVIRSTYTYFIYHGLRKFAKISYVQLAVLPWETSSFQDPCK